MTKRISCIMADYTLQDDGTMDCPWLTPYYGDMTEEEYHAAGTALSVRRGCEYCYKHLEFKTTVQEEGWKSAGHAVNAKHPDWPGEWVSVWTYQDGEGNLVGYECQNELFKSLHEIEAAGWELIYSYCPSGKEIYKKEEESLNTYHTKCGREFEKNTNASVTGYKMDEGDQECVKCPFRIEVTKGWPAVFDHWECRAGSLPPNQKDDWRGSVNDKNTLSVRSLHNDFLESVLEYCKAQPDLSAAYNQDLDDCRRQISVSCSSNKKGMAAKKALVEKFFGQAQAQEEETEEPEECCETCAYGIDMGESVEYIKCQEGKNNKDVKKKQPGCANYVPVGGFDIELDGDLEDQIEKLLNDGDKADLQEIKLCIDCSHCQPSDLGVGHPAKHKCFNASHRHGAEWYFSDKSEACKNFEQKEVEEVNNQLCRNYNNGTECHKQPDAPQWCLRSDETSCTYFKSQNEENAENDTTTTENVNELAEIDTKASEIVTFDYSTVDEETAEFLQDRASKITFINAATSYAIGKELKEAQEKLANNKNGVFQAWCRSLKFSDDTAYNYIHTYNFITERFGDIGKAENFLALPQKLQYAVSKPSAPKELQDQVLSGDITTHKQYKEKEAEWKEKLEQSRSQQDILRTEKQQASINAMDAERRASKLENEAEDLREQLEELKNQNTESQDTLTISKLQSRINQLEDQLKDKPIETSAVRVVERVPEKNSVEIKNRLYGLLLAVNQISKQDIQIVSDSDDYAKKMALAEFLENIRDNAPGYINMLYGDVITHKCEECEFCSWDGLKEADENNGLILCTQSALGEPRLTRNDSPCHLFKER